MHLFESIFLCRSYFDVSLDHKLYSISSILNNKYTLSLSYSLMTSNKTILSGGVKVTLEIVILQEIKIDSIILLRISSQFSQLRNETLP